MGAWSGSCAVDRCTALLFEKLIKTNKLRTLAEGTTSAKHLPTVVEDLQRSQR
jgi:hypothetical protein